MIRSAAARTRQTWSSKFFLADALMEASSKSLSKSSENDAPPNLSKGEPLDGLCELLSAFGGDGDAGCDVVVLAVIVHVDENELLVQLGVVFHGRATFLEAARCPDRFRTQPYTY